jgi:hypothetical protein
MRSAEDACQPNGGNRRGLGSELQRRLRSGDYQYGSLHLRQQTVDGRDSTPEFYIIQELKIVTSDNEFYVFLPSISQGYEVFQVEHTAKSSVHAADGNDILLVSMYEPI